MNAFDVHLRKQGPDLQLLMKLNAVDRASAAVAVAETVVTLR